MCGDILGRDIVSTARKQPRTMQTILDLVCILIMQYGNQDNHNGPGLIGLTILDLVCYFLLENGPKDEMP
ncbi:hypothetical protein CEXT_299811 [Caerostris extrusa]|uniref:Uncharacterized protein n=1 Tax=Caerostris extrusa TaxID=172846 RepID=A0AAV4V627_CAEEX|nr:hypothetical protein CEXT_299811 [Caerostris extrusa]